MGCIFTGTHPAINPNRATRNQSKHTAPHPTLMFHYPCLLAESGRSRWSRCRNPPPFATKSPTRATRGRKCHIAPQSAAFCISATFGATFSALSGRAVAPIRANKSAPRSLRHFPKVEHYSTLGGEIMVNLMTEQEVSKRLNVSVASLRRWRLLGRGPAFLKIGSLVRYRPEDLDRWLASLPTGGSNGPGYSPDARGEYG